MRPFPRCPVALLAALVAVVLVPGASVRAASDASDGPARTLDLTGMTYVGSSEGRNEIVIEARDARVLPDREQVLLAGVDLTLVAPGAGSSLTLQCDHGELDLESGDFVGVGEVRGKTPDGRRFETERLHYAHGIGLVTSDAPVVIRDGTASIRGGGLSYQVKEGQLHLLGGATVVQGP